MIWGLAHPGLGEREVTQAMLERDHQPVRAGQVILGGKGFAGRDFEAFVSAGLQADLVRPDRKDEPRRFGQLARQRQWIEAIIDTLKGLPWAKSLGEEGPGCVTLPCPARAASGCSYVLVSLPSSPKGILTGKGSLRVSSSICVWASR